WKPDIQLDAEGKAAIVVPLNDSITSFRLVAMADEGASRFGEGSATIVSTQDVQVISGLPALLREGDRFRATVTVRNTTARDMRLEVQAGYEGPGLPAESLPSQTLDLAAGQAHAVHWEVTAPQ